MKLRSSRFSPRLIEARVLEQLTVGREQLVSQLVTNLSDTIASGQGRFDLLVGPRGIGKSHTLGLVEARVRASAALRERVLVVSLPEEFHPSSLVHLLARVLEGLPVDDVLPPVSAQLSLLRGKPAPEAEQMAAAMIRGRLRDRSLLLMLENLDALLRGLGREPQARLRKILQTERSWSIFATARSEVAMTRQSEPFHGTFVVKQLEPLSPMHGREMMVKLAVVHADPRLETWLRTEAGLARARGIHHLVGGTPRVVAMLFHHLNADHPDDFEANFCGLAEELTPYYQQQMARLSAGQLPVMEFLAERWSPVSVQEIADGTFNETGSISTHLRALRRDHLVQSIAVGKERFYEIAEPLHRIARAMKRDSNLGAAIASIARVFALVDQADAQPDLGAMAKEFEVYWLAPDTLTSRANIDPDRLASLRALEAGDLTVAIGLWIATGRDIHRLSEALRPHADQLHVPADVMTALAAEDNTRAFVRLGAELRLATRELLRLFHADEALAALPSEPSPMTTG